MHSINLGTINVRIAKTVVNRPNETQQTFGQVVNVLNALISECPEQYRFPFYIIGKNSG